MPGKDFGPVLLPTHFVTQIEKALLIRDTLFGKDFEGLLIDYNAVPDLVGQLSFTTDLKESCLGEF